ncbi:MAG: hypothetical protein ACKO40_00815 [Planctomycetaceae bacterium]
MNAVGGPASALLLVALQCAAMVLSHGHSAAAACPFCGPVGRSLAERRDAAVAVLIATAERPAARDADGLLVQPFTVLAALRGDVPSEARVEAARVEASAPGTAVLFGVIAGDRRRWEAIPADETLIDHVARAPAVEEPAERRLRWFVPRLEHPSEAIAADAFTEFGLAPFESVRAVADTFDVARLRAWLADDGLDPRRRGFYGLALGLAARSSDAAARTAAIEALRAAVDAPGSDLRAWYDGILAGFLVADGAAALADLADRGLFAATTRAGDARHALAALRFAWESLRDTIPQDSVAAAAAGLLDNPAVAADAAVDLARYQRWDDLDRVAALWTSLGHDDPLIRRAVAGYLEACPLPAAAAHRERLAGADPVAWQAARAAAAGPAR